MTESIVSRETCKFMLENQVAKEFREWVQDIKAPEEFFYATLARVDRQSAIDLDKKIYMGKKFLITVSLLYINFLQHGFWTMPFLIRSENIFTT